SEKFVSFSINNLVFIDAMSFIQASLESLILGLSGYKKDEDKEKMNDEEKAELRKKVLENINTKFKHFNERFKNLTDEQKLLLIQKGIYPYDYGFIRQVQASITSNN